VTATTTAWETAAAKTGKEKFQQKFDFLGKHTILLLSLKTTLAMFRVIYCPKPFYNTPSVVYYDVFDGNI